MFIAVLFATQTAISFGSAAPLPVGTALSTSARTCVGSNAKDIVVCGRKRNQYRIDPAVVEAERTVDAIPSTVQNIDPDRSQPCVGPRCGGEFLPLVAVGYKVVTAAVDAATGNDWKKNFRTHPDEYAAYHDAKDRGERKPVFGFSASASSGQR